MSTLLNILINDILISDNELLQKGKEILSNKSYEDLIKLVSYKNNIVTNLNEKYKKELSNIHYETLEKDIKEKKLSDMVLEYFMKRKELEYKFLSNLF